MMGKGKVERFVKQAEEQLNQPEIQNVGNWPDLVSSANKLQEKKRVEES